MHEKKMKEEGINKFIPFMIFSVTDFLEITMYCTVDYDMFTKKWPKTCDFGHLGSGGG